jgi:vacuolar-type H+-ATPase subunit H
MVRSIDDVKTELRKLTDNKPMHAVAGAGVLASQTLKELPGRLVQWTKDNPPESLPGRANGYVHTAQSRANGYVQTAQSRANGYVQNARNNANGYVQTARTRASGGYDKLAEHGKKAINGPSGSAQSRSTTAQSSRELNGKPKGKTPSSRTRTSS